MQVNNQIPNVNNQNNITLQQRRLVALQYGLLEAVSSGNTDQVRTITEQLTQLRINSPNIQLPQNTIRFYKKSFESNATQINTLQQEILQQSVLGNQNAVAQLRMRLARYNAVQGLLKEFLPRNQNNQNPPAPQGPQNGAPQPNPIPNNIFR